MTIPVITDTATLNEFCARQASADFLTVDTEFHRENTYTPKLCLIQVAGPDEAVIIDPLADGIDLSALWDLMTNSPIIKVLHACRQDMEIVYTLTGGKLITPLFDTQVAAQAVGFGESPSYETLVRDLVGATLDKGQRFTDWQRRPLSENQLNYAIADVTHLRIVYTKLIEKLDDMNRHGWIEAEMASLLNPGLYEVNPDDAYKRVKVRNQSPKMLARLQALAKWREEEAKRRNIPRQRIAKDDALQELMLHPPKALEDFKKMRMLRGRLKPEAEQAIIDVLAQVEMRDPSTYPDKPRRHKRPDGFEEAMDMLKLLLKTRARALKVPPRILASNDDLEQLILTPKDTTLPLLQGWRGESFGNEAKAFLAGDFGMCYNPETLSLDFVPLNK